MDLVNLIVTLVSGIIGGNLAGAGLKDKSLGAAGNSVTGAVGGGATNWLLHLLGVLASTGATAAAASGTLPVPGSEGLDIGALLGNVVGSGAGGAILTAIVAFIKQALQQSGEGGGEAKK